MSAYVGSSKNLKNLQGKHGLSTEQLSVSAFVGSSKNLKDLNLTVIGRRGMSWP